MFRLFLLTAMLGSLLGTAAPQASAWNEICAEVWTGGDVPGYRYFGGCEPYNGPTLCATRDAGLDPRAHVYTRFCIPD